MLRSSWEKTTRTRTTGRMLARARRTTARRKRSSQDDDDDDDDDDDPYAVTRKLNNFTEWP